MRHLISDGGLVSTAVWGDELAMKLTVKGESISVSFLYLHWVPADGGRERKPETVFSKRSEQESKQEERRKEGKTYWGK